jgi:hypothetical protein
LNHLRAGRSITALIALSEYGVFRLASIIYNLRNDGWRITTAQRKAANGTPYAIYRLR